LLSNFARFDATAFGVRPVSLATSVYDSLASSRRVPCFRGPLRCRYFSHTIQGRESMLGVMPRTPREDPSAKALYKSWGWSRGPTCFRGPSYSVVGHVSTVGRESMAPGDAPVRRVLDLVGLDWPPARLGIDTTEDRTRDHASRLPRRRARS